MAHHSLCGLQYGDEGKARVVDYFLSQNQYQAGVRFNGGGNAGHTVYIDGEKFVLHHLPISALYDHLTSILGHGMVIDPVALLKEIDQLQVDPYNIIISDTIHITRDKHKEEDGDSTLSTAIGTTKKGIGPTYRDKYNRSGMRLKDLYGKDSAVDMLYTICRVVDSRSILRFMNSLGSIFFEASQGIMLDVDLGTYPYVTSSHCTPHGIGIGAGFDTRKISCNIGVMKPYLTRVGAGPFETEDNSLREILNKNGIQEIGATTGRDRRVGWLNIDELRYAVEMANIDEIIITKMDALNNQVSIPVFVDGAYQDIGGWQTPSDYDEFVNFIENKLNRRVIMLTNGVSEEDVVIL